MDYTNKLLKELADYLCEILSYLDDGIRVPDKLIAKGRKLFLKLREVTIKFNLN